MTFSLTAKRLFLVSLVLLSCLALYFFLKSRLVPPRPSVVSTTPPALATEVDLFNPLTVAFSDEISIDDLSITSTPEESWSLSQKLPTVVVANSHLPLSPSTKYEVRIAWRSQQIMTFTFTTMASQSDPKLLQELQDELDRDYPLAKKTPYKTPSLRVVYSSPLTLEITLLAPGITADEATQEIKAWVTREGGDAAKHQYKVVPYSP